MSAAKEQDHRNFLNSLRSRLNVDEKTIANLERRITGKFPAPELTQWEIWPVKIPSRAN